MDIGLLLLMFLVAILLKTCVLGWKQGPMLFFDELYYKENAFSLHTLTGYATAHYPPLYSLILSVSFFFDDFFSAMQFINVVISSTVVFPAWLMARRYMGRAPAYLVGAIVLLLPFHWLMPAYVMSENLAMPLVLTMVWLATKPLPKKRLPAVVQVLATYLVAGLMVLTRYQLVVLMVVCSVHMALKLFWFEKDTAAALFSKWQRVLLVLSLYIVGLLGLLGLALASPSLMDSIKNTVLHFVSMETTPEGSVVDHSVPGASFLQWLAWYLAYLLLAVAPFVLPFLLHIKEYLSDIIHKKYNGLLLFTFLCYGALVFVAVRHSWLAGYNRPIPHSVIGRYISYAVPLLVITIAIMMAKRDRKVFSQSSTFVAFAVALVLVSLSYYSLFGRIGYMKKEYFVIDSYAYDILAYENNAPFFYFAVICVILVGVLYAVNQKKAITMVILSFFVLSFFIVFNTKLSGPYGTGLSNAGYQQMTAAEGEVDVLNLSRNSNLAIRRYIRFWNLSHDAGRFTVHGTPLEDIAPDTEMEFLLTSEPLYDGELHTDESLYVYTLPLADTPTTEYGQMLIEDAAQLLLKSQRAS